MIGELELLLGQPFMSRVQSTFALVNIAEEEIVLARKRWPLIGEQIDKAFMAIVPTCPMPDILYRAHAAELLARIPAGQSMRPATDAECIAALMEWSTISPPSQEAFCLYWRLLRRRLPDIAAKIEASCPGMDDEFRTHTRSLAADMEAKLRRGIEQRLRRGIEQRSSRHQK